MLYKGLLILKKLCYTDYGFGYQFYLFNDECGMMNYRNCSFVVRH